MVRSTLVAAYFLVTLIGLAIRQKGLDRKYRANTARHQTHSLFQLGWKGWRLVRWLPRVWLASFHALDFDASYSGSPFGNTPHGGQKLPSAALDKVIQRIEDLNAA